MSQVIVRMSVSLDGFGAGPRQSLEHPLGEGGHAVHEWMFPTRTFYAMVGREGGETGVDDEEAVRITRGIGATVMGRNMFGPVRGPWTEPLWEGWWGPEPPYHGPVFVLTHHARDPLPMEGGTTFHFVTGGIEDAIARARDVAGDRDISVAGGVSTARQALRKRVVPTKAATPGKAVNPAKANKK